MTVPRVLFLVCLRQTCLCWRWKGEHSQVLSLMIVKLPIPRWWEGSVTGWVKFTGQITTPDERPDFCHSVSGNSPTFSFSLNRDIRDCLLFLARRKIWKQKNAIFLILILRAPVFLTFFFFKKVFFCCLEVPKFYFVVVGSSLRSSIYRFLP